MPKAFGQKFMWRDHDTDQVSLAPPVQNQWYEVFHGYDVQLLRCRILQVNGEAVAKIIEVRWTIDGNVYFTSDSINNNIENFVYRANAPSTGGTDGIDVTTSFVAAARNTNKCGQDFKVEVRITSALGTNQTLLCQCVRETLELT